MNTDQSETKILIKLFIEVLNENNSLYTVSPERECDNMFMFQSITMCV